MDVTEPPGSSGNPSEGEPAGAEPVDLLGMDLETLRTTEHPVLAELLAELRERVAAPGSETLWAFDNVSTPGSRG
jgi:FXSXX-COOH protein